MTVTHLYVPPPARLWALIITSIAFFMAALDTLIVVSSLPAIQREMGASLITLEWTINAYALAAAAAIITTAALGDRFGRRRVFATGLALFTVASAVCALAPSPAILIAARALQGLGSAIIVPLGLTILTSTFPVERRGTMFGIWGGVAGVAVAIGPVLGGMITQRLDWHWIFWVNVPIGLTTAILSVRCIRESYGPPTRLDLPAVALVSAGAIGVVLGLSRASDIGWANLETIVTIAVGLLLLAVFLIWEQHAIEPMLPLRLFRGSGFAAANATSFFQTASALGGGFLVLQYMQVVLGYSALSSGLLLLPRTAMPMMLGPLAGMLSDRVGRRPLIVGGAAGRDQRVVSRVQRSVVRPSPEVRCGQGRTRLSWLAPKCGH